MARRQLPDIEQLQVDPYLALFAQLDPELPLALLPVRIETRFIGQPQPSELLVRVFPDLIHTDPHDPALTAHEQELAQAFWRRTWRAGGDPAARDAAFAWLAEHLGPWRAAWVASEMTPRNQAQAPSEPVSEGDPLEPRPRFPTPEPGDGTLPVYARLLPQKWVVVPIFDDEPLGIFVGEPIPETLVVAPRLAVGAVDGRGFLDTQELAWTHDSDAAERIGMLVRIDLDGLERRRFDSLVVVGINPDLASDDIESLLWAHRYTHGLDLIPQGTATNATETVVEPWHPSRPDPAVVRASELDPPDDEPRPEVSADGDLTRMAGADAVSVALGLGRDNAFDRSLHAGVAELAHAEAMNRVLWPATFGHYFTSPLSGVLDDTGRAWLRDWATAFVRGGGPLPTLLVGSQPYGLLPASVVAHQDVATLNVARLEQALLALAGHWTAAVRKVPHLDPNLTDASPDEDAEGAQAAVISQVMGTVPHPTALRLRHVDALRSEYNSQFVSDLFGIAFRALFYFDSDGNEYGDDPDNFALNVHNLLKDDLDSAITPEAQVRALEEAVFQFGADAVDGVDLTDDQKAYLATLAATITDDMIPLVEAHLERILPVRNVSFDFSVDASGLMGDDDDPFLYFSIYADAGEETTWNSPLVAPGPGPEDVSELAGFLTDVRARVVAGSDSEGGYGQDKPLLRHLVNRSADLVSTQDDRDLLVAGLDGLIDLTATDPDPVETMERLLRESLGVASYRLDAWYTAVAAWRLENKRAERRRGVHIGAYGFVVDLRQRDSRPSQGHVLAPSLSTATTAAVLRSGWAAFGGDAETAGLAVDLSSDRIRRARWLTDGVRRGQDLAELLGSRFERRLHDAGLDRWMRPFRELVLEAQGRQAAPNGIVDGLLLARGHGGGPELSTDEQALANLLPGWLASPDRPPGDPADVLDELVADLDASADAAVAQAVFSLVEGNTPEAMATLAGATSGAVELPHLRFADSPRSATTITHRLVALVDPAAKPVWPGATTSGRARAAPGLEAWVEGLLGAPEAIGFAVGVTDAGGKVIRRIPVTLDQVGAGALDLVFLTPAGEGTGLGRLGEILAAWAQAHPPAEADDATLVIDSTVGDPSLDEVVAVARLLRALVANGRDLDARSFAEPGTTEVASGVDVNELSRRVDDVAEELGNRRMELAAALRAVDAEGVGGVLRAIVALSGFELRSGAAAVTDDRAVVATGERLLALIARRVETYTTMVEEQAQGWPAMTDDDRRSALEARLNLLVGQKLPWAPSFTVPDGAALAANFERDRLDTAGATAWLAAAGRVDPGAARLRTTVDLVEAIHDKATFGFQLAQLPDHPEAWAAVRRPTNDGRGRTCIVTTGVPAAPTGAMAGLALTSWTEPIPGQDQTPAIAFHFDAPSSRPPQAVILCVAKPEEGFSFDYVRSTVSQVLTRAQLRMVGPETLEGIGQYVPAIYLPDDLEPGAAT